MNRFYILLLLLCSSLARVSGQNDFLATWDFDNGTPAVTTITGSGADDVNGEDVVFGPGVGIPPSGQYPVGNPASGLAYSGDRWTSSSSRDASDYLQCCVNTDLGTVFTPGANIGFIFDNRRSGTGPTAYEVRASADNFSSSSTLGTGSLSGTDFVTTGPFSYTIPSAPTVTTRVCFRVYGYGASGTAGTWRFDNIQMSGPSALPVTWLHFSAHPEGTAVALDWATATEQVNDYFSVERSADGARYEAIGRVTGAGTSTAINHYAYTDEKPLRGLNYYRLRQVDFDGGYAFSRTVAITTGPNATTLSLFPNPATDHLTVQLTQADEPPLQWLLIDAAGRVLRSGTADTERFDVAVGDLAQGLYGLRVVTTQWTTTQLFIRK